MIWTLSSVLTGPMAQTSDAGVFIRCNVRTFHSLLHHFHVGVDWQLTHGLPNFANQFDLFALIQLRKQKTAFIQCFVKRELNVFLPLSHICFLVCMSTKDIASGVIVSLQQVRLE